MLNTVLLRVQAEISNKPDLSLANEVLNGINWVVVAVFYLEKWMVDFWQFWRNTWNIFDFLLTFLSVLPEIIMSFSSTNTKATGIVKVLRTFRVLRALKITSKFRQMLLMQRTRRAGRGGDEEFYLLRNPFKKGCPPAG
ncbi:hypothetical protein AOLI_G00161280 [Acnodon oligacanthus]